MNRWFQVFASLLLLIVLEGTVAKTFHRSSHYHSDFATEVEVLDAESESDLIYTWNPAQIIYFTFFGSESVPSDALTGIAYSESILLRSPHVRIHVKDCVFLI